MNSFIKNIRIHHWSCWMFDRSFNFRKNYKNIPHKVKSTCVFEFSRFIHRTLIIAKLNFTHWLLHFINIKLLWNFLINYFSKINLKLAHVFIKQARSYYFRKNYLGIKTEYSRVNKKLSSNIKTYLQSFAWIISLNSLVNV